jgi:2-oxoglutarate dehydrogenase E1 component
MNRDIFHGPNAAFVWELYERFQDDPEAVDPETRKLFAAWSPATNGHPPESIPPAVDSNRLSEKVRCAVNLAQSIRELGHLAAQLDPLGTPPTGDPTLRPETYDLTDTDLHALPASVITGPLAENAPHAAAVINALRDVYCTGTGYDNEHILIPEEREWLRDAAESGRFHPPAWPTDQIALLERLTKVEVFEQFLHRFFPGKTRFSIEGLDMMVPMLDEIVWAADEAEVRHMILGMAHRGRLNVLAHVLHKPYAQILAEFKDPGSDFAMRSLGWDWSGDVKYHTGQERRVQEIGEDLLLTLVPNPSHLEHVNPVVVGMARAAGTRVDRPGTPEFYPQAVLPILIHGDAAFPGQGIVAETLNMSRLPGYSVGGTLHIIANNQLGYTTLPADGRSTRYASDLAKGFKIPIIHVNADDPVACIAAVRMAFAYRQEFGKDFVIDLIGYRRYGHNEGDEPTFTQPRMYQVINDHPTVRQQLAGRLVAEGLLPADRPEQWVQEHMATLQDHLQSVEPTRDYPEPQLEPPPRGMAKRAYTAVPTDELRALNQALLTAPDGFHLHPKVARGMRRRRKVLDDPAAKNIDWATAEDLALASILADGVPIRLTGEDVQRGTFSHRHAVWHDAESGATYTPLQAIPQARAAFEIHNSPLSENGALGFEYGYNIRGQKRLVIWEAQFGDFINGAQAVIDEFIVSGRTKWEQTPSLVLLLPHGHEGQGPDHSTGRLERFLQMAAEINLRVTNPSHAANYFHLLRRQSLLLESDPLPLIVMTPKSLLRHPLATSTLTELSEGGWQRTIDDPQAGPEQVRRLIWCSGKVYVDLIASDRRAESPAVAIARLEQLYPFPYDDVQVVLARYPQVEEVIWLQEEPQNMGAWTSVSTGFNELLPAEMAIKYMGRPGRASPAEGTHAWHKSNQEALIEHAYFLE